MFNKDNHTHSLTSAKIVVVIVLAKIAAGIMLLLALGNWGSSFYDILRIFIFISSAIFCYKSFRDNQVFWAWSFVAIGILFNPIFPIYLQKDIWKIIDIAVSIFFFSTISKDIDFLKLSTTKSSIFRYIIKTMLIVITTAIVVVGILFLNSPLNFFSTPKISIDTSFASKVTVSGKASPLSTVRIYADDNYVASVKVNNDGLFSKLLTFDDGDSKMIKVQQQFYIFSSDFSESVTYYNIQINPQYQYLLNN